MYYTVTLRISHLNPLVSPRHLLDTICVLSESGQGAAELAITAYKAAHTDAPINVYALKVEPTQADAIPKEVDPEPVSAPVSKKNSAADSTAPTGTPSEVK
jgi:hypothetical protein